MKCIISKKYNMIYKKFGKLTVLEELPERTKDNRKIYKCICECGNIVNAVGVRLRNGTTQSCGCLLKYNGMTHGKSNTRIYKVYRGMLDRCYCKTHKDYKDYGKRGIIVCQEWLDDFMNFYKWAMNHKYNDNLTIDRINVNGNYEPSNCRWVTNKEQQNNKRSSVYLTYQGKTQTMTQWSNELGINYGTIKSRKKYGWSDKECLFGKNKSKQQIIYKYDYITNKIIDSYDSIKSAADNNEITENGVRYQLKRNIFFNDRGHGYYFGYSPKRTIKIFCYDNESLELLGVYGSMKEASEKTGVNCQQIHYQCQIKTQINNRVKGSTGLFFEKRIEL